MSACWNATSVWTRPVTLWSACAGTFSAGPACTSGWKHGRAARCALCVRPPSAERRSYHCMAEGTPSRRTLEIRCPRGRPGSARSPRVTAASRASVSARASTCPSASAPSPSASSLPPSTSATPGPALRPAAPRSTRRSSSCRRYSCGWPSCSCCGSSSHDQRRAGAATSCRRAASPTRCRRARCGGSRYSHSYRPLHDRRAVPVLPQLYTGPVCS